MRPFSDAENARFAELVGRTVIKKSGKPFKSGAKKGTVTGTMLHPTSGHLCYTFAEDDSYVECFRCIEAPAPAEALTC